MDHETIVQLLPWYVNGTLPPHERAAVESELASCPLCARELAELQRIHAAMHEIDADAPGPSEFLFNRTLARIDDAAQTKPPAFSLREWWRGLSAPGKIAALVPVALALALVFVALQQNALRQIAVGIPPQERELQSKAYPAPARESTIATDHVNVRDEAAGGTVARSAAAPVSNGAPAAAPAGVSGAKMAVAPSVGSVQNFASTPAPAPPPLLKSAAPTAYGRAFQRPQLIRTGSISMLVPDVERAIAQLSSLAQLQFGDVVSLDDQTPSAAGLRHTADIEISVPADRFDDTMTALAKIGAVQARAISAENVSDQIVDAQARLRNLRHTEADMLRILDRSGKIPDVLDVTQQIAQVREQIEQLDAQLQSMQHRVAYSTISISIEDEKPVATAEPSFTTQLGDSWRAALRSVRGVSLKLASFVLVLVAFAPYWLAISIIALLVANRLRAKT